MSRGLRTTIAALALASAACGGDGAATVGAPSQPSSVVLSFSNLRPLDPATEGSYQAWVVTGATPVSLGRFTSATSATLTLSSQITNGAEVWITVEPPGDADDVPSPQHLLRGVFSGRSADLSIVGAVTQGTLALRPHPGQFTMFSPSDNALDGYPSYEESGVWLFNMAPRTTEQDDMWVRLSQLAPGWTYEGWMVRDIGLPSAIWLSYGKFIPDYTGAVNSRDDTGWGPFSGVVNYKTDGEEEFPGDDWISNPLNLPFPKDLTLPLDLREMNAAGAPRWTHVITIEPAFNRGEAIGAERPFLLRPYQDPFGTGAPGDPRTITFHAENLPSGRAEVK